MKKRGLAASDFLNIVFVRAAASYNAFLQQEADNVRAGDYALAAYCVGCKRTIEVFVTDIVNDLLRHMDAAAKAACEARTPEGKIREHKQKMVEEARKDAHA